MARKKAPRLKKEEGTEGRERKKEIGIESLKSKGPKKNADGTNKTERKKGRKK